MTARLLREIATKSGERPADELRYGLLGPLEVRGGGSPIALGGARQRDLLAVLLLAEGRIVSTERLIDVLWDEAPPPTARTGLHVAVSQLRRSLARGGKRPSPVVSRPPGYLLEFAPGQLDLEEFERQNDGGRRALAVGDAAMAAAQLRAALALWRGPALGGVQARALRPQIQRLEERRLACLEQRITAELALGLHADLVAELDALVTEHPLKERLRAAHMLALYRSGRRGDALASYRRARQTMVEELGLEPGAELRELERAILVDDRGLYAPRPPAPMLAPTQLPPDVVDFTGREDLLVELASILAGKHDRVGAPALVAMSGKPGVGKSALAVHVAHRLREVFPDGQLHASLRGAQARPLQPGEVLGEWLRALGVGPAAIPDGLDERVSLYRAHLAGRRVLVLLDDAADEVQLRPLLPAGPGCAMLATSRHRLVALEGARHVELDVLPDEQAITLLARIAGAQRVTNEPGAARAIVHACGALPLAVRVAGARLATRAHWPLAALAERLGDERRRLDELAAGDLEVRASVALSYRTLDAESRRAMRLLGALDSPDFAPWLAAAVLDTSIARAEDVLGRLTDRQLLDVTRLDEAGQLRHRFHDLLRVFARERIVDEETPEAIGAALARAHGACLALAEQTVARLGTLVPPVRGTGPRWQPSDPERALAVLDRPLAWFAAERGTLVACVEQAATLRQSPVPAWELAASLSAFWEICPQRDDWRRVITTGLDTARRDRDRRGESVMLRGMGFLHCTRGSHDLAIEHFDASLAGFISAGDRDGEAATLLGLGSALGNSRPQNALEPLERCLQMVRDNGDKPLEGRILVCLGIAQTNVGRLVEAGSSLGRALDLIRRSGQGRGEGIADYVCGRLHRVAGRLGAAATTLERGVALLTELGDRRFEAYARHELAMTLVAQGRLEEALSECRVVGTIARELDDRRTEGYARHGLGVVAHVRGRLDAAAAELEAAAALLDALGEHHGRALSLHALGDVRREQGRTAEAIAHLRTAVDVLARNGFAPDEACARASLDAVELALAVR